MTTYYITPTGLSQGDLVNFLKDVETAMGGTNSDGSITTTTTPLASQALSRITSASVTPLTAGASILSAGATAGSAVSAILSAGSPNASFWSHYSSRISSALGKSF